jgi:hypothetical protein
MSLFAPNKILMTTDAVGGVWTYSTGLASALAAAGMEVHLVTLGPPPRQEKRAMLRNPRVRLIESNLALESSRTLFISTAFAKQLSTGWRRWSSSRIPA